MRAPKNEGRKADPLIDGMRKIYSAEDFCVLLFAISRYACYDERNKIIIVYSKLNVCTANKFYYMSRCNLPSAQNVKCGSKVK